jgi:hypothetical protein
MFELFHSLVGKFAGVGVQITPSTYKEGKTYIQLDHTWIYVVREKNNTNDVGTAKDPMPKRHCFIVLKFNKITNDFEIRKQYERVKLTTSISKKAWIIDLFTINSRVLRVLDKHDTVLIVPGRWIRNYNGGNYNIVSVQGDHIFATSISNIDTCLVKKKIRLATEQARDIIRANLNKSRKKLKAV